MSSLTDIEKRYHAELLGIQSEFVFDGSAAAALETFSPRGDCVDW